MQSVGLADQSLTTVLRDERVKEKATVLKGVTYVILLITVYSRPITAEDIIIIITWYF